VPIWRTILDVSTKWENEDIKFMSVTRILVGDLFFSNSIMLNNIIMEVDYMSKECK